MDQIIKLESSSEQFCIACARCDIQTFGEHEMNLEILSIFKELLKDYIQNLNGTPIVLCVGCMEMLSTINDFKNKCIQTFLSLSSGVLSLMFNHVKIDYNPEVKLEETFTANLNVDMCEKVPKRSLRVKERNTNIIKDETSTNKKGKRTKKVGKTKKKIKISKPTEERNKTITKSAPTYKKQKGYCIICCSNQVNIYGHYLDLHSRKWEDETLSCILCDAFDLDVYQLESHMESQHKEFSEAKKCGRCEVEIKNRKDFVEHVHKTHFKERRRIIPCDFCDSVYYEIYSYKYHIRRHAGAIKCKLCEKSFFDDAARMEHIKTHENSKIIQKPIMICDFCGYSASNRQYFVEHIFTNHVKGLEVKCEFCGKEFKTKKKLRNHVKDIHNPKIRPCPHCGKKFRSNPLLGAHIRKEHTEGYVVKVKKIEGPKERKWACDLCPMKFFKSQTLKKHKYSHSKTRPYNCHLCSTGYYMNAYLRGHYLREHGVQYTSKEIREMCGFGKSYRYPDSD